MQCAERHAEALGQNIGGHGQLGQRAVDVAVVGGAGLQDGAGVVERGIEESAIRAGGAEVEDGMHGTDCPLPGRSVGVITLNLGPSESAPSAPSGDLVPAAATWSQILDYAAGTGDDWPFDLYSAGVGGAVVRYAALFRVLTLISGTIAQLVCAPGSLRVMDRDGRRVRSDRVIDLLTVSPDGGDTPSSHLVEDAVSDYLVRGTSYLLARRGIAGVNRLERMLSGDRSVYHGREGGAMLRLRRLDGTTEAVARRDVAVVRWPRLIATDRIEGASPLTALRPALDIGIQGDRYIREWFRSGAKAGCISTMTHRSPALTSNGMKSGRAWISIRGVALVSRLSPSAARPILFPTPPRTAPRPCSGNSKCVR